VSRMLTRIRMKISSVHPVEHKPKFHIRQINGRNFE
jgi:hypothetical protein